MRVAEAAAFAALVIAAPAAARANGAFPAAEAVLVPADRPQEIMLVTNFGVVLSEDGAQTWSWSCEQETNALGTLYQWGPAPRRRLFAVANQQVVHSDDATCSWQIAGGLVASQSVTDAFPDPTNADRVLAIAVASALYAVFESADGGATFGTMLYQGGAGETVTSVESARSDPRVVYVALMGADQSPRLARSGDGGAHWTVSDLGAVLGPGIPRIIAVDPADAGTVLLRWSSVAGGEAIAVTHDGGATATRTLDIEHYFTSFARLADGALMLSAVVAVSPAQKAGLFLSHDGGATFQENDAVPGVLALAARGGTLYAATDNFGDGYALGASTDEGASFQPVMRFDQIGSIMACLRANAQCQASCEALAGNGLGSPGMIWDEAVCNAGAGGVGGGGAGGGAPAGTGGLGGGAAGTAGAGGSAGGTPHSSGGGCSLAPGRRGAHLGGLAAAAALALLADRRRRLRARS
ncbi:MAG TPA: hypothetical protein VIF57_31105 [Polyangia bacterium]